MHEYYENLIDLALKRIKFNTISADATQKIDELLTVFEFTIRNLANNLHFNL